MLTVFSSPAHKGPTNTNKMSKFLEERKELNYRAFNSYCTSFSFQYEWMVSSVAGGNFQELNDVIEIRQGLIKPDHYISLGR